MTRRHFLGGGGGRVFGGAGGGAAERFVDHVRGYGAAYRVFWGFICENAGAGWVGNAGLAVPAVLVKRAGVRAGTDDHY